MNREELVQTLIEELKKFRKLEFRVFEVLDILSGNYEAYLIKCGEIEVRGDTDRCVISVVKGNEEIYRKDFLERGKDYQEAMDETFDFFRKLVNRIIEVLDTEGIKYKINRNDIYREVKPGLLLKSVVTISLL